MEIELFPSLSHCIETTAKQEFWKSVDEYMERQGDKELGEKIALLKAFVESMDFRKLRRESEKYLIEGKEVRFIIRWKGNRPQYEMIVD
jgi:translation initiation factor IF-3